MAVNLENGLFALLFVGAAVFGFFFLRDYLAAKKRGEIEKRGSSLTIALIGALVCFFDALGLGGFAPLMALFRYFRLVNDRFIPGTLNTAMCIPTVVEALIFLGAVRVDTTTLVLMLMAAVLGGILGAGIIVRLDRKKIQLWVGIALVGVFGLMLVGKLGVLPVGGDVVGLSGWKLSIAVAGNFILGALMSFGVGLNAPCMALVYSLGMSPIVAFPIMMGSSAALMPAVCLRFIKAGAYNRRCTLIITMTGVIGVVVAVYIVKSLPLDMLTWLVMGVIGFTAVRLLTHTEHSEH